MFSTINDTGDRGRTASLGNLPSYRDPMSALTTWGPTGNAPTGSQSMRRCYPRLPELGPRRAAFLRVQTRGRCQTARTWARRT